jgi:hypothetical protein
MDARVVLRAEPKGRFVGIGSIQWTVHPIEQYATPQHKVEPIRLKFYRLVQKGEGAFVVVELFAD